MDNQNDEEQPLLESQPDTTQSTDEQDQSQSQSKEEISAYTRHRHSCQHLLVSKQKHYLILALVALDVSCLLADIFIALIDCDERIKNDDWVPDVREGLEHAGLVFSCMFLVELILCLWAFGLE